MIPGLLYQIVLCRNFKKLERKCNEEEQSMNLRDKSGNYGNDSLLSSFQSV